jgi:hypothetical protein
LDDVIYASNVRVIKPSHRTNLAESPLAPRFLPPGTGPRHPRDLPYRHLPVQQLISGQPDSPHPAPAQDNPEPVAVSDKAAQLSTTHHGGLPGAGTS